MSDYISQDLLFLVLKPFPVKTLLRFRCVCKSWKEVIDSKSFILDHLSLRRRSLLLHGQHLNYLIFDTHTSPSFHQLSVPHPQLYPSQHLLLAVNTVDGVICLYNNADLLLLWNPSIRRLLTLPVPPQKETHVFKCFGFWMDPCTNHFKVVVSFLVEGIVALFCSTKWAWTQLPIESDILLQGDEWECTRDPHVLIEGVGHWLLYHTDDDDDDDDGERRGVIACFDYGLDRFGRTFELPEVKGQVYSKCMVKWRDSVAIVVTMEQHPIPCYCDLWAMQNGSWGKMFSFNLIDEDFHPVYYVAEDYGRVLSRNCAGDLVFYDTEAECIHLKTNFIAPGRLNMALDFVESLFFPDPKVISSESVLAVDDRV